jgi:hypothetical protein
MRATESAVFLGISITSRLVSSSSLGSELKQIRDCWFLLLLVCTGVVVLGVFLEEAELWLPSGKPRLDMAKGTLIPSRWNKWKDKMSRIGWILIILGVVGEGLFEAAVSSADGMLQDFNDTLLASAIERAGNAASSAKTAHDEADRSQIAASNALTLASGARQEADSFEADIKTAKRQAADAESHLADALEREVKAEAELYRLKTPRSLIRSGELIANLKHFGGTEYTLNVFMDDESIQFTKALASVLQAAGWVRQQPQGINLGVPTMAIVFDQGSAENVPACVETGISIYAHTKESIEILNSRPVQSLTKELQAALALKSAIALSISPSNERNVVSGIIDPKPAEGPMTVCVGKKP